MPDKCYTVTQAYQDFSDILDFVEEGHSVELTRHGNPVAVVVSVEEYRAMHAFHQGDFWQVLQDFRQEHVQDLCDINEVIAEVCDAQPKGAVVD